MDAMSAGAAAAAAAATAATTAPGASVDAATKPDKAADDKAKAVEAEAAPKPVVKPRRDRKVGPCTSLPLCKHPAAAFLVWWSQQAQFVDVWLVVYGNLQRNLQHSQFLNITSC